MKIYIPWFPDTFSSSVVQKLVPLNKHTYFLSDEKIYANTEETTKITQTTLKRLLEVYPKQVSLVANDKIPTDVDVVLILCNPAELGDPRSKYTEYVLERISKVCSIFRCNPQTKFIVTNSTASKRPSHAQPDNHFYQLNSQIVNCGCPFTIIKLDLIYGFKGDFLDFLHSVYEYTNFYPNLSQKNEVFTPLDIQELIGFIAKILTTKEHDDQVVTLTSTTPLTFQQLISFIDRKRDKKKRKWLVPTVFQDLLVRKLSLYCSKKGVSQVYIDYLQKYCLAKRPYDYVIESDKGIHL